MLASPILTSQQWNLASSSNLKNAAMERKQLAASQTSLKEEDSQRLSKSVASMWTVTGCILTWGLAKILFKPATVAWTKGDWEMVSKPCRSCTQLKGIHHLLHCRTRLHFLTKVLWIESQIHCTDWEYSNFLVSMCPGFPTLKCIHVLRDHTVCWATKYSRLQWFQPDAGALGQGLVHIVLACFVCYWLIPVCVTLSEETRRGMPGPSAAGQSSLTVAPECFAQLIQVIEYSQALMEEKFSWFHSEVRQGQEEAATKALKRARFEKP